MNRTIANRLRFVAQMVVKRIKQMTRLADGSDISNLDMDLARSKHDLIENAPLRQQLVVLERRQKRPKFSNWDRIKDWHRKSRFLRMIRWQPARSLLFRYWVACIIIIGVLPD